MNFDELKQQCLACQRCGLCETRTHVVFGQGVPDAEVLFVGEGPAPTRTHKACRLSAAAASYWTITWKRLTLTAAKIFILPILLSAARQKTATLPRKNPLPASRGCACSSGCCAQKLWCAWAALPPSR